MSWNRRIKKAAIEQEVVFSSYGDFEKYKEQMRRNRKTFQILKVSKEENGSDEVCVIIRRPYNQTDFFVSEIPEFSIPENRKETFQDDSDEMIEKLSAIKRDIIRQFGELKDLAGNPTSYVTMQDGTLSEITCEIDNQCYYSLLQYDKNEVPILPFCMANSLDDILSIFAEEFAVLEDLAEMTDPLKEEEKINV